MKPATTTLFACTTLLLMTACRVERTERPALADPAAVARTDIEMVLDSFEDAVAAADVRRAAAIFLPDGTVTHGGSVEVNGRAGIAEALQTALSGRSVLMTSEGIDVASGAAWQVGTYEVTQQDTVVGERGRFAIRWQRGPEASWRIHHMMLAPLPRDSTRQPGGTVLR